VVDSFYRTWVSNLQILFESLIKFYSTKPNVAIGIITFCGPNKHGFGIILTLHGNNYAYLPSLFHYSVEITLCAIMYGGAQAC
jgi:hypothetical protein